MISRQDIERFERDLFSTFRVDESDDVDAGYQALHTDDADAPAALPAPTRSDGTSVAQATSDLADIGSTAATNSNYGVED
ncbi:hypothetical protein [Devosia nitrariae]|uniref:Uncharacterized protein n=1 Tax=Devosia nitrariae TaxID=2071872 RepID=A0ABQ5W944_9HYPH|nr:hypothetical protein [Devosia nitrariae]GLQ56563.1 hypothetical protein GCM10010862_38220 [Devosia nitrariae]